MYMCTKYKVLNSIVHNVENDTNKENNVKYVGEDLKQNICLIAL